MIVFSLACDGRADGLETEFPRRSPSSEALVVTRSLRAVSNSESRDRRLSSTISMRKRCWLEEDRAGCLAYAPTISHWKMGDDLVRIECAYRDLQ